MHFGQGNKLIEMQVPSTTTQCSNVTKVVTTIIFSTAYTSQHTHSPASFNRSCISALDCRRQRIPILPSYSHTLFGRHLTWKCIVVRTLQTDCIYSGQNTNLGSQLQQCIECELHRVRMVIRWHNKLSRINKWLGWEWHTLWDYFDARRVRGRQ